MTAQAPVWLDDVAELRALLHLVVDRFDKQPGDARARNIVLAAEKCLPSLTRNDAEADQLWALVRELERVRVLAVQSARRSPYDSPWVGAKLKFPCESESLLRAWLDRAAAPSAWQQWREAVMRFEHAFADRGASLSARRITIAGRTSDEVLAALASLAEMRGPATLRQLSTLAFWGDSKVLDDRGDIVAAAFPQLRILDRKVIVAVHLPAAIAGVLFVENQDTYASLAEGSMSEAAPFAIVFMSGFRVAAARVRTRAGAALHFSGPGYVALAERFSSWWFEEQAEAWPLHFWGDLDFAGMQILKSLRARFAHVAAWRPGYEAMLAQMQRGGVRTRADDGTQADPVSTGCEYADGVLLPAIRSLGFRDQERIELR